MKPFDQKTFADIINELNSDGQIDFDAYCIHYKGNIRGMLIHLDNIQHDGSPWKELLTPMQFMLLMGLTYVKESLQFDDYFMYLYYIINPHYTDDYRKEVLHSRLNDIIKQDYELPEFKNKVTWQEKATKLLELFSGAHEGDIGHFANNLWSPELTELENIYEFIKYMQDSVNGLIVE